ncbi:MAG: hypothetical protein ABF751_09005, partial [Acetobacter orientalis]|uniref:hypothetical protein n=1 Tax=Acetobacter orientalis TaxID=146474 RepID=UPI0039E8C1A4
IICKYEIISALYVAVSGNDKIITYMVKYIKSLCFSICLFAQRSWQRPLTLHRKRQQYATLRTILA